MGAPYIYDISHLRVKSTTDGRYLVEVYEQIEDILFCTFTSSHKWEDDNKKQILNRMVGHGLN